MFYIVSFFFVYDIIFHVLITFLLQICLQPLKLKKVTFPDFLE